MKDIPRIPAYLNAGIPGDEDVTDAYFTRTFLPPAM